MAKPWDDSLKKLVRADPEAFVQWLLPEGRFQHALPYELKLKDFDVDGLLRVRWRGEEVLMHIEFQSYHDSKMAQRLLRYHVLARCEYGLPVISYVIYLFQEHRVPASPLRWRVPMGQEVLRFHFVPLALGEMATQELRELGYTGLLPLLPLTRGGNKREVISQMLEELQEAGKQDLSLVGFTLASLVFQRQEKQAELDWLIRRFAEMHEILRDSPIYQLIEREGEEKGLEKGLERGLERGLEEGLAKGREKEIQALRETLFQLLAARFGEGAVTEQVRERVQAIGESEALQKLIVNVSLVKDGKEAQGMIIAYRTGS